MDNNNYQTVNEQTQSPQYATSEPAKTNVLPQDVQQRIDNIFGKALASAIMSEFPIASIIAIFFGNNALKEVVALIDICRSMSIRLPGKLVAARILAIVGKVGGIVCTCIYAGLSVFYAFYFILFFGMAIVSGF